MGHMAHGIGCAAHGTGRTARLPLHQALAALAEAQVAQAQKACRPGRVAQRAGAPATASRRCNALGLHAVQHHSAPGNSTPRSLLRVRDVWQRAEKSRVSRTVSSPKCWSTWDTSAHKGQPSRAFSGGPSACTLTRSSQLRKLVRSL